MLVPDRLLVNVQLTCFVCHAFRKMAGPEFLRASEGTSEEHKMEWRGERKVRLLSSFYKWHDTRKHPSK